jgi:hypothetical protein
VSVSIPVPVPAVHVRSATGGGLRRARGARVDMVISESAAPMARASSGGGPRAAGGWRTDAGARLVVCDGRCVTGTAGTGGSGSGIGCEIAASEIFVLFRLVTAGRPSPAEYVRRAAGATGPAMSRGRTPAAATTLRMGACARVKRMRCAYEHLYLQRGQHGGSGCRTSDVPRPEHHLAAELRGIAAMGEHRHAYSEGVQDEHGESADWAMSNVCAALSVRPRVVGLKRHAERMVDS